MAKDPAFLFYPGDWLGGTIGMSFEEKGAYMELLMMQFTRGHMTSHMIAQTVGQLWVNLQHKFKQDTAGLWYNERLDLEKEKRKNFVTTRKNNKEGKNQYSKQPKKVGHMTSHMENEDVNEDVNAILNEYENWTQQIFDGNDALFEQMFMREQIPQSPNIQFWIMDHRDLLNRYPKMRPPNQQAFRQSCLKHIRENYKKPTNGKSNSITDSKSRIDEIISNKFGPS